MLAERPPESSGGALTGADPLTAQASARHGVFVFKDGCWLWRSKAGYYYVPAKEPTDMFVVYLHPAGGCQKELPDFQKYHWAWNWICPQVPKTIGKRKGAWLEPLPPWLVPFVRELANTDGVARLSLSGYSLGAHYGAQIWPLVEDVCHACFLGGGYPWNNTAEAHDPAFTIGRDLARAKPSVWAASMSDTTCDPRAYESFYNTLRHAASHCEVHVFLRHSHASLWDILFSDTTVPGQSNKYRNGVGPLVDEEQRFRQELCAWILMDGEAPRRTDYSEPPS